MEFIVLRIVWYTQSLKGENIEQCNGLFGRLLWNGKADRGAPAKHTLERKDCRQPLDQ